MQNIYSVTIANSTGAAPNDGFIDNTKVQTYMAASSSPATLLQSQAKRRANIRFHFLQQQIQFDGNIYMDNMVATGANSTTEASTFIFNATCEHDDQLYTHDETAGGAIITGIPALTRMCARALIEMRTLNTYVYDPTLTAAPGNSTTSIRMGDRVQSLVVGPASANLTAATALVTITKIF